MFENNKTILILELNYVRGDFEKVNEFKYLRAIITENNEVRKEVKHRLIQETSVIIHFRGSYHPEFSLETLSLEYIKL